MADGDLKPPSQKALHIAGDMIGAYLDQITHVDQMLFRGFTRDKAARLHDRLGDVLASPPDEDPLRRAEWDDLSLLLRSISMSLQPFPDLTEKYRTDDLYAAIDEIAAYALALPDDPPEKITPRGWAHGL